VSEGVLDARGGGVERTRRARESLFFMATFASSEDVKVDDSTVSIGDSVYDVVDVGGEGDCLFRCLAHIALNDEERHGEVRARITSEMASNPARYAEFITTDRSVSERVERMAKRGEWGDEIEIVAFCYAYASSIGVVTRGELVNNPAPPRLQRYKPESSANGEPPTVTGYLYHARLHFQVLRVRSQGRRRRRRRRREKRRRKRAEKSNGATPSPPGASHPNGDMSGLSSTSPLSPQKRREKPRKTPSSSLKTPAIEENHAPRRLNGMLSQMSISDTNGGPNGGSNGGPNGGSDFERDELPKMLMERQPEALLDTDAILSLIIAEDEDVDDDEDAEDEVDEEGLSRMARMRLYDASTERGDGAGDEVEISDDEDADEKDAAKDDFEADARSRLGKQPYQLYFKKRQSFAIGVARKISSNFHPRQSASAEEAAYLRSLLEGNSTVTNRANNTLLRIISEDAYRGTGPVAAYVRKAGGTSRFLSFLVEHCPMWPPWIFGVRTKNPSMVLDEMVTDGTIRWSGDGRPLLAKEEVTDLSSMQTTIKVAREVLMSFQNGKAKREMKKEAISAIESRLQAACPNDFLIPGAAYVIAYGHDCADANAGQSLARYPYVGQTTQLGARIGQHLAGVEGCWRLYPQGSTKDQPHVYGKLHALANLDIRTHDERDEFSRDAADRATSKNDKRRETKIRRQRRHILVQERHFIVCTAGVFVESAQRDIVNAYVNHCREMASGDEGEDAAASPTVDDCVRFMGCLKWIREIFETMALKSLHALDPNRGLNSSPPGEPFRWRSQRWEDKSPWTDEEDKTVLKMFMNNSTARGRMHKSGAARNMVADMLRHTGTRRSYNAIEARFRCLYLQAARTPERERSSFQRDVIATYVQFHPSPEQVLDEVIRKVRLLAELLDNRIREGEEIVIFDRRDTFQIPNWSKPGAAAKDVNPYNWCCKFMTKKRNDGSTREERLRKYAGDDPEIIEPLDKVLLKMPSASNTAIEDIRKFRLLAELLDNRIREGKEIVIFDGRGTFQIPNWSAPGADAEDVNPYNWCHWFMTKVYKDGSTREERLRKYAGDDPEINELLDKVLSKMPSASNTAIEDIRKVRILAELLDNRIREGKEIVAFNQRKTFQIPNWSKPGAAAKVVNPYDWCRKFMTYKDKDGSTREERLRKYAGDNPEINELLDKVLSKMSIYRNRQR